MQHTSKSMHLYGGHMLSASIQLLYILIKLIPTQCESSVQSKCHGSQSSGKGENRLRIKFCFFVKMTCDTSFLNEM